MTRTNRVLSGHNKAGFHSGRLHAHNIIAGKVDVTLGTGDGTATVTFARPMPNANYRVLLCPQEATTNDDLVLSTTTKTPQSFVINVYSTGHTSPITIGYLVLGSRGNQVDSHGRFGFHSGNAHFRNLQWGKAVVTVGAGSGTALTITLPKPMKHKPLIFLSFDDDTAVTAGFAYMATGGDATNGSFIIDVASVAGPTSTVDITWVAFDPGFTYSTTDAASNTGNQGVGGNRQSKFGIHSGDFRAKNFIGGIMADEADGNGDGEDTVTFGQMLRQTPVVFSMVQSPVNDTTGVPYVSTITINAVTLGVNNSATTTATVYHGFLVIDYEWLPTKAAES